MNDTITLFGSEIKLQHTSSGHYCIPITPKQIIVNHSAKTDTPVELYLTINNLNTKPKDEKKSIAIRLHKQFLPS